MSLEPLIEFEEKLLQVLYTYYLGDPIKEPGKSKELGFDEIKEIIIEKIGEKDGEKLTYSSFTDEDAASVCRELERKGWLVTSGRDVIYVPSREKLYKQYISNKYSNK